MKHIQEMILTLLAKQLTTQVHFLDPIPYEEYKDMKTPEIAEMVRGRIEAKVNEVLEKRKERRKFKFFG